MASDQLEMIIAMLRAGPDPASMSVAELRAHMEQLTAGMGPPPTASVEAVDAGGVPAEWVRGDGASDVRTIMYLHGGGYMLGSPKTHRNLAAALVDACAARVLLVDYRLAPEHPHPAAVEDAAAAYAWLLERGADPARVVIAGDSAGGGLTVATLVAIRERGLGRPAAGVCLSPWVDMAATGDSMTTKADVDPMLTRVFILRFAEAYLGGKDPATPLASPLHADLEGLPPLLIQVGTAEVLLDDATRLAERARAAGVDVTLDAWEDMIHVFQAFGPLIPEAGEAIARIGRFVRARAA